MAFYQTAALNSVASSQLPVDKNYQFITINRTVINPVKP